MKERATSETIEQVANALDAHAKEINPSAFVTVRYHVGLGWFAIAHIIDLEAEAQTVTEAVNALSRKLHERLDQDANLAKTLGVAA